MSTAVRTWGIWQPTADGSLPQGTPGARPLEWWPSTRAAKASLRARTPQAAGTINTDTERRADGRTMATAQFYGSQQSVIFLYKVEGDDGGRPVRPAGEPFAVLEFGPRGGVRRRSLVLPAVNEEAVR
ncbi:hypothetical protein OHS33_39575 (plasmid) [Streptomyces sp. NBC_00536]|uniref:hypothetical protein n=1 Tax=Streptomyces sp. NBC_00536 TaxID=2975769 RepID=UPI002E820745|nr:hypothetical protein [Streptomyces sp. NBC_00536]WUC84468.1 hypothetical protein OHS33_39575 [Streptomyces sp. NBC_00536]